MNCIFFYFQVNKHFEILVRCSDKERNCIQANETAFNLMKLHASDGTSCKLMDLHVSSGTCMQAYLISSKPM